MDSDRSKESRQCRADDAAMVLISGVLLPGRLSQTSRDLAGVDLEAYVGERWQHRSAYDDFQLRRGLGITSCSSRWYGPGPRQMPAAGMHSLRLRYNSDRGSRSRRRQRGLDVVIVTKKGFVSRIDGVVTPGCCCRSSRRLRPNRLSGGEVEGENGASQLGLTAL